MQNDAKVVRLSTVATQQSPNSPAGRLPVALIQLRDKAAQQLKQALQALFDNADDTLFEMADRATSNAEQNAFFEAMRELRLKRRTIERTFLQNVFESFATLNQYQIGAPQLDVATAESLSLVNNDDLEENVALDAMVARVMSRDAMAIGHLTTRLNAMITQKLDDKSNPLGPRCLCEQFVESASCLSVEIRVRLIILKLFEKYVLSDIDQLFSMANEHLIEAGVLPELKSTPARRRTAPGERPAREPAAEGHGGSSAGYAEQDFKEVFGVLQDLLAEVRGNALLPRRELPVDALPISSNDLMRLLSHMQQRLPAPSGRESDFDLRDQLQNLLSRASAKSGRARVVGEVDEDVINLVSMLFEFILDDRTLPDSLKALIGRLQIPMLKVAVLDKTFFSRGSHPARRLLNEIASAALGWNNQGDEQRDQLFQHIEQVVQRLLNDFTDDTSVFSDLLAEFLAFTGDERRRSELLEQRTRDAEEGRAKAELARLEVEHALNQRMLGKILPEVVVRLLQEGWSKVMQLACLKFGAGSPEWEANLSVMDDLIWSVEPHEDAEDRLRLLELVPNLLKALREGLAGAAVDPFVTSEFFSQLESVHVQAFQRFKRVTPEPQGDTPLVDPLNEHGTVAAVDDSDTLLDMPAMIEVVEEIVLSAPGEKREHEAEVALPHDDGALQQVDSLRVGSWVEIAEDEEHKLRCKLAAIIKPTSKYIFVNRTGMKVLEKTRMGLAVEFRRGSIRLLDDALLFDRALESVISNLRRLKEA
ncbi:DUF1631 domain-containing protein [Pseudomonas sp. LRF_L74]|uniref:DUF1631 domain-containing protein n=1 Tax=Pseudomonas sp. LRF_L74 TaxID=3369422 RepID=UPI003F5FBF9E